MFKKIPSHILSAAALCLLAVCAVVVLAREFTGMWQDEPIYPGPGVSAVEKLSDYFPRLKDSRGDTDIYVLDSGKPGASMLVLGGTHPNEPAGFIAALSLVERCQPREGILYVIPRANRSAFTCTDPQEAAPMYFTIETAGGPRVFRFGSRATNPIDQWPDREVYVHASSGQTLSGMETRNLNRAYPGLENGNFTEQIAFGIASLIREKDIDITIDLHEASPEYPTINALVSHERAMDVAAWAVMYMQMEGMQISLEVRPRNLRGLSHRELGDHTDTLAVLFESANASQGRLRGPMSEELIVKGVDPYYTLADSYGKLYVSYPASGISLSERVARHLCGIEQVAVSYNESMYPKGQVDLGQLPGYSQLMSEGIGAFLAPPREL